MSEVLFLGVLGEGFNIYAVTLESGIRSSDFDAIAGSWYRRPLLTHGIDIGLSNIEPTFCGRSRAWSLRKIIHLTQED